VDTPMTEFGGLWPGYVSGAHHGVTPPGYGHPFLKLGEMKRGHIYSLVMYNNFRTNFINVHPGETLVRYTFGTHKGDWQSAKVREFGWNAATPPLTVWMNGPQQGTLNAAASWCQIDAPNVMLLTFKRAEDGNGFILRLIETAGAETESRVTIPLLNILHAYETNLVEENQRLLPCTAHTVQARLKPFGIATIRLVTR
jgi:alpha-mannosidase